MYADLARRVGADPACADSDLTPEKDTMKTWLLPLLTGLLLGACATGIAWSFSEIEREKQELAIPDLEPTEEILWTVDVDGESAP